MTVFNNTSQHVFLSAPKQAQFKHPDLEAAQEDDSFVAAQPSWRDVVKYYDAEIGKMQKSGIYAGLNAAHVAWKLPMLLANPVHAAVGALCTFSPYVATKLAQAFGNAQAERVAQTVSTWARYGLLAADVVPVAIGVGAFVGAEKITRGLRNSPYEAVRTAILAAAFTGAKATGDELGLGNAGLLRWLVGTPSKSRLPPQVTTRQGRALLQTPTACKATPVVSQNGTSSQGFGCSDALNSGNSTATVAGLVCTRAVGADAQCVPGQVSVAASMGSAGDALNQVLSTGNTTQLSDQVALFAGASKAQALQPLVGADPLASLNGHPGFATLSLLANPADNQTANLVATRSIALLGRGNDTSAAYNTTQNNFVAALVNPTLAQNAVAQLANANAWQWRLVEGNATEGALLGLPTAQLPANTNVTSFVTPLVAGGQALAIMTPGAVLSNVTGPQQVLQNVMGLALGHDNHTVLQSIPAVRGAVTADALSLTLGQAISGWFTQVQHNQGPWLGGPADNAAAWAGQVVSAALAQNDTLTGFIANLPATLQAQNGNPSAAVAAENAYNNMAAVAKWAAQGVKLSPPVAVSMPVVIPPPPGPGPGGEQHPPVQPPLPPPPVVTTPAPSKSSSGCC